MRIDGINNVGALYKSSKATKAYETSNVSSSKDTLALSDFAKSLQSAKLAVDGASDIRESRVEALRQQIEAGTYSVSGRQIADKLLENYNG